MKRDFSQREIATLILNDLSAFNQLLYSADFSTKKGGQQFVKQSLGAIQDQILSTNWTGTVKEFNVARLYLVE